MFQQEVDISNFIKLSNAGLKVASFTQIRAALIERYKQVYGEDIDLSTGSADGIFVNDLALMINNILQSMLTMYQNLDINTASGIYLDNLCRFSNIIRQDSTYSNATLIVTNVGSSDFSESVVKFVDQAGNEWTYNGTLTLAANAVDSKTIQVTCDEPGPIEAPVGWINQTLQATTLQVTQENEANVGANAETDSELRTRRILSLASDGVTVLESLQGSLLELSGIEDVKIYNNNTDNTWSSSDENGPTDGTTVQPHSIYVILRKQAGVDISDSDIGTIIQQKLTPGIPTNETGDATESSHEYEYVLTPYGLNITDYNQIVYWKEAIPINPAVIITLNTTNYFSTEEIDKIANAAMDYLNALPISEPMDYNQLLITVTTADPLFRNQITYTVADLSLNTVNKDTYYYYNYYESDTSTAGKVIIKLGNLTEFAINLILTGAISLDSNPTTINEGKSATLSFTATDGYELPDTITVTGVDNYTWTKTTLTTGTLVLNNEEKEKQPSQNIIVTIKALSQLDNVTELHVVDTTANFLASENATSYEFFVDDVSIGTYDV